MNVSKRYINAACARGEIRGAYKEGYRWLIPEDSIFSKRSIRKAKRVFNTTGICDPTQHYMVSLGQRMLQVKTLVDEGKYFTINRARQYGKTTTLHALSDYLSQDYFVVSMDFQMQMSDAKFRNENAFALAFARAFVSSSRLNLISTEPEYDIALKAFASVIQMDPQHFELVELFQEISLLCAALPRKVVLMIDEIDSATNNQVFIDFLAKLRGYYNNRNRYATFQSVILAGVCDIKNLKQKLRPEEEHTDNSPWNIAADFDIEMSFSPEQIAQMLKEYESDHRTGMNGEAVAQEIYDYTAGYPYLVSRICQLLELQYSKGGRKNAWTHTGILDVVRSLVGESNSLFDDMSKKVKDYPTLRTLLYDILFCGKSIPYNPGTELVSIGTMFGFLKDNQGQVAISNRIFEIWFYNLFIAEEAIRSSTYDAGERDKNQFIQNGRLDMDLVLKKFVQHFTESFGDSTESFVEENGRKLFLLYIRPLINGSGNYYIEARTRSMGRTDLIIDYLGIQYVIEMKIWNGQEYNTRGEKQLIGYLKDYGLKKGYMLSFNFNKNKTPGVQELHFKEYTIVEAVV
ncbi:MAG: AAA-like domain-containing protein [Eubacterium sp.]|nr:AAA-like domain-containing protein [Eubacterium sp.]